MDEHPQDSDVSATGAQTIDKPRSPATKKKVALGDMITTYLAKGEEIWALFKANITTSIEIHDAEREIMIHQSIMVGGYRQIHLSVRTINLDEISTLDVYDRLLALSKECLRRQAIYNARERIIITKVREVITLEAEILGKYGNELGVSDSPINQRFAKWRGKIRSFCNLSLRNYMSGITNGWFDPPLDLCF